MKSKLKNGMTFGDLITAAYQVWGAGQAEKMVRFAVRTRLVVFCDPPRFLFASEKGRSL